ncbi:hypothetical protein ACHMWU_29735 [Aeromicrobium sp. UC242_57]
MHGDLDEMIVAAEGAALAAGIVGATHESWSGVGHLFWWERPDDAAALVLGHTEAATARR